MNMQTVGPRKFWIRSKYDSQPLIPNNETHVSEIYVYISFVCSSLKISVLLHGNLRTISGVGSVETYTAIHIPLYSDPHAVHSPHGC